MVDAQGRPPRPDSTRTPSGCGWQAGYPREPTSLSTGKSPFSPISLAAQLQYLPTRTITRLHGYPRYLDSSRVLGRLFPTHRFSCAHPSSAGSLSMAGTGCRRGGTQGHSSESPRRPALTQGKGKSTSKLPLPLKLPRSCTVDFLPFMLDDVCSQPTPANAHAEV